MAEGEIQGLDDDVKERSACPLHFRRKTIMANTRQINCHEATKTPKFRISTDRCQPIVNVPM